MDEQIWTFLHETELPLSDVEAKQEIAQQLQTFFRKYFPSIIFLLVLSTWGWYYMYHNWIALQPGFSFWVGICKPCLQLGKVFFSSLSTSSIWLKSKWVWRERLWPWPISWPSTWPRQPRPSSEITSYSNKKIKTFYINNYIKYDYTVIVCILF